MEKCLDCNGKGKREDQKFNMFRCFGLLSKKWVKCKTCNGEGVGYIENGKFKKYGMLRHMYPGVNY